MSGSTSWSACAPRWRCRRAGSSTARPT